MSKIVSNRSRLEWKILIAEYETRSVSSAYFCELHEVSKGQVYKWRRHFLSQNKSVKEESAFIPLTISNEHEFDQENFSNITSAIKISSGSGVVVEFISGCRCVELKAIMGIFDAAK